MSYLNYGISTKTLLSVLCNPQSSVIIQNLKITYLEQDESGMEKGSINSSLDIYQSSCRILLNQMSYHYVEISIYNCLPIKLMLRGVIIWKRSPKPLICSTNVLKKSEYLVSS